jgi:hypothetical protein
MKKTVFKADVKCASDASTVISYLQSEKSKLEYIKIRCHRCITHAAIELKEIKFASAMLNGKPYVQDDEGVIVINSTIVPKPRINRTSLLPSSNNCTVPEKDNQDELILKALCARAKDIR